MKTIAIHEKGGVTWWVEFPERYKISGPSHVIVTAHWRTDRGEGWADIRVTVGPGATKGGWAHVGDRVGLSLLPRQIRSDVARHIISVMDARAKEDTDEKK